MSELELPLTKEFVSVALGWLKQGGHIGLNKVHLDTIGGPVSSNGTGGALAFSQLAGARKAKTPASKKACKEAPKKRQNFEKVLL